ncbi:unnamed protein product [Hapterophycus canaliculatus]
MDNQPAVGTTEKEHPDEVQMGVIIVPLLLSIFLVAAVLAYRCRAYRLRRDRLAQEQQQELEEMKAAREMDSDGGGSPRRNAALIGLGSDQYMSAYKKLLSQA